MKETIVKLMIISFLLMSSCGYYAKIEDYQNDCEEYYALSTKSFNVDTNIKHIIKTWESQELRIIQDTTYSQSGNWMSPQIKVYNFHNTNLEYKIEYIKFITHGINKVLIQLHGVCLEEKQEIEFLVQALKSMDAIIRKDLIEGFLLDPTKNILNILLKIFFVGSSKGF